MSPFNCTVTTDTGLNSGPVAINGNSGATGFGFWDDTNPISQVTITCDPGANGFAIGEFGVRGASAVQPPNIKLSPISSEFTKEGHLDFGEVLVATQKGPAIVKIENQGSQTVFISGITIEESTIIKMGSSSLNNLNAQGLSPQAGETNYILDLNAGDYPCRTTQFNLGPGNYCTVGIIFAPQSQGRKDAFLSVYPNSPYPEKIYMTGVGVVQTSQQPAPPEQPAPPSQSTSGSSQTTSGGGGGGCSMSAGVSPVNVLAWLLIPALMILRRLKRG